MLQSECDLALRRSSVDEVEKCVVWYGGQERRNARKERARERARKEAGQVPKAKRESANVVWSQGTMQAGCRRAGTARGSVCV